MTTETQVKERPIIFSGEMVLAILDGRKTQTRRVMKPQPIDSEFDGWNFSLTTAIFRSLNSEPQHATTGITCPYGVPGDYLYVRETHYAYGYWSEAGLTKTGKIKWEFIDIGGECRYLENPPDVIRTFSYKKIGWYKRPSIFMPMEYSRILLEIVSVRVERVQQISEEDAIAEGCKMKKSGIFLCSAGSQFHSIWNSINEKRGFGWDKNPWVWVVEFKVVKPCTK